MENQFFYDRVDLSQRPAQLGPVTPGTVLRKSILDPLVSAGTKQSSRFGALPAPSMFSRHPPAYMVDKTIIYTSSIILSLTIVFSDILPVRGYLLRRE